MRIIQQGRLSTDECRGSGKGFRKAQVVYRIPCLNVAAIMPDFDLDHLSNLNLRTGARRQLILHLTWSQVRSRTDSAAKNSLLIPGQGEDTLSGCFSTPAMLFTTTPMPTGA